MTVNLASARDDIYLLIKAQLVTDKVAGSFIVNSFPQATPSFPAVVLPMVNISLDRPIAVDGTVRTYRATIELDFWVQQKDKQSTLAPIVDAAQNAFTNLDEANIDFVSFEQSNVSLIQVGREPFYNCGAIVVLEIVK